MKILFILAALGLFCWLALSIYTSIQSDVRQKQKDENLIQAGKMILDRLKKAELEQRINNGDYIEAKRKSNSKAKKS